MSAYILYNTGDNEAANIRDAVGGIVTAHDWVLQMHGFYLNRAVREMRFDVVLSFEIDREEALTILYREVGAAYPEYELSILPDVDISD